MDKELDAVVMVLAMRLYILREESARLTDLLIVAQSPAERDQVNQSFDNVSYARAILKTVLSECGSAVEARVWATYDALVQQEVTDA